MGRRGWVAAVAASVLWVSSVAAPTAGGGAMFGYGLHTEHVGLHWILDAPGPDPEHPAVTCRYSETTNKLRSMLIREPVILADVSGGPRTQLVGWRAIVQRADAEPGPWQKAAQTPLDKANATGKVPADLRPRTVEFAGNVDDYALYRVVYRLFWYAPNGTTVADRAVHLPFMYGLARPGLRSYISDRCESSLGGGTAGVGTAGAGTAGAAYGEGAHSGKRGLHWILDHIGPYPEYPAVTCDYDADGYLVRLRIRRPIVHARDTGPGVQRADVAWKAIIQSTPQDEGTEVWSKLGATSSTRRSATDKTWAAFLPKTFQVGDATGLIGVRVVYQLTWYKGRTSTVAGRAKHFPLWYTLDPAGGLSGWEDDYCPVQLSPG